MILVKIHEDRGREVIAVCDSDLIGKEFNEGKLHIEITENFFKGKEMQKEDIIRILKSCSNLNVVGKESIKLALDNKIIEKESVIKIKGIPISMVVAL